MLVLSALFPPREAGSELLELKRLGLRVGFSTLRQWMFVIPHVLCRPGAIENNDVSGDVGVGGEDPVGEAHDGVEVELFEQVFLDVETRRISSTMTN